MVLASLVTLPSAHRRRKSHLLLQVVPPCTNISLVRNPDGRLDAVLPNLAAVVSDEELTVLGLMIWGEKGQARQVPIAPE
jgi:hypothetical protein